LTDTDGKVLAATSHMLEGVDASKRPWFDGARNRLYLGDPHEAKLLANYMQAEPGGEPIRFVDVAVPVGNGHGVFQGVLAAHLHWTWVRKTMEQYVMELESPMPIQVFVASKDGLLLNPPAVGRAGTTADLLATGTRDGSYLVAVSSPNLSSDLGWTVVARKSMSDTMEPI